MRAPVLVSARDASRRRAPSRAAGRRRRAFACAHGSSGLRAVTTTSSAPSRTRHAPPLMTAALLLAPPARSTAAIGSSPASTAKSGQVRELPGLSVPKRSATPIARSRHRRSRSRAESAGPSLRLGGAQRAHLREQVEVAVARRGVRSDADGDSGLEQRRRRAGAGCPGSGSSAGRSRRRARRDVRAARCRRSVSVAQVDRGDAVECTEAIQVRDGGRRPAARSRRPSVRAVPAKRPGAVAQQLHLGGGLGDVDGDRVPRASSQRAWTAASSAGPDV